MEQESARFSVTTNTLHDGMENQPYKGMNFTNHDPKIKHTKMPYEQELTTSISSLLGNFPVNRVMSNSIVTRKDSTCTTTVHSSMCLSTRPTLPISTIEARTAAGLSATDHVNDNGLCAYGHNHIGHSDSLVERSANSHSIRDLSDVIHSIPNCIQQSETAEQIPANIFLSNTLPQLSFASYGNHANSNVTTTTTTSSHTCSNHNVHSSATLIYQPSSVLASSVQLSYSSVGTRLHSTPISTHSTPVVKNMESRDHLTSTQNMSSCAKSTLPSSSCTTVTVTQSSPAASRSSKKTVARMAAPNNTANCEVTRGATEDTVVVPFGWRREVEHGAIVYYSPSDQRLYSIEQVMAYLMSSTTCKCGLECPLVVKKVFNFQPDAQCQMWSPTIPNHLTNLCHHRKKIVAMAHMATMTCPANLQPSDINFSLTSSPNSKDKKKKQVRKPKKPSPYDGVLVSQLLAQRDKLNKLAAFNSSNNVEVSMDILSKQADDLKAQEEIVNQQIAAIKQKLAATESTKKENEVKKTSRKRKKTNDNELTNSDHTLPVTPNAKQYPSTYPHGMTSPPMAGMMFSPHMFPGGMMPPGQVVQNHMVPTQMVPNQMAMNQMVPNQLMANQIVPLPMQNQMVPQIRMAQGIMHPGMPQGQMAFPPQGMHFRQVQNQGVQNGVNQTMQPNMFPGQPFPGMRPMGFPAMGPHPGNMMMQGNLMQMYPPAPQHFSGPMSPGGQHMMSPVAYSSWPDQHVVTKKARGKRKKKSSSDTQSPIASPGSDSYNETAGKMLSTSTSPMQAASPASYRSASVCSDITSPLSKSPSRKSPFASGFSGDQVMFETNFPASNLLSAAAKAQQNQLANSMADGIVLPPSGLSISVSHVDGNLSIRDPKECLLPANQGAVIQADVIKEVQQSVALSSSTFVISTTLTTYQSSASTPTVSVSTDSQIADKSPIQRVKDMVYSLGQPAQRTEMNIQTRRGSSASSCGSMSSRSPGAASTVDSSSSVAMTMECSSVENVGGSDLDCNDLSSSIVSSLVSASHQVHTMMNESANVMPLSDNKSSKPDPAKQRRRSRKSSTQTIASILEARAKNQCDSLSANQIDQSTESLVSDSPLPSQSVVYLPMDASSSGIMVSSADGLVDLGQPIGIITSPLLQADDNIGSKQVTVIPLKSPPSSDAIRIDTASDTSISTSHNEQTRIIGLDEDTR